MTAYEGACEAYKIAGEYMRLQVMCMSAHADLMMCVIHPYRDMTETCPSLEKLLGGPGYVEMWEAWYVHSLHLCTCMRIRTPFNHAYAHTHTYKYIYACIFMCIQINIHTHTNAYANDAHAQAHACACAYNYAYTFAFAYAYAYE